jgi:hypothetical protein
VGPRRQRHNGEGKRGSARAGPTAWFGPAAGPKARRKEIFFFSFSFSNISKHFQIILNPLLNLNQTTHLKNLNATA